MLMERHNVHKKTYNSTYYILKYTIIRDLLTQIKDVGAIFNIKLLFNFYVFEIKKKKSYSVV